MKRVAIVAVVAAGLGLFGTGVRGVAQVDERLSDAADRAPARGLDVRRETRGPGACPGHERQDPPAPSRDELEL